jgi:tetratricopeptide (TPR) repeat protein
MIRRWWVFSILLGICLSFSCANRTSVAKSVGPQPTPPVFQRQINNALYAGEGDLAVRAMRQTMAAEPDNIKVRVELAEHYRKIGSPDLAVELCRLTAERFPDAGEIQLVLAKSFRDMGMRKEAGSTLEQFVARQPQRDPAYYSWLGIIRDESGQWKEGESWHRQALAVSNLPYLHNNLGYNLLKQGKKEQAAAEFRKVLELQPNSQLARNNLGAALASNPKEALQQWQPVSGPAAVHNNLANVLMDQGRYAEAQKELEKALEYNKSNSTILSNLRVVAEMQKKPVVIQNTQHGSRARRALDATWRAVSGAPSKTKSDRETQNSSLSSLSSEMSR